MHNLSGRRICFLAGTLEHGGAERQLFYIVETLVSAGAAVRVLSLDQGGFWERRLQDLGASIRWVGQRASRMKRLVAIAQEVQRDPPDILQSQHFFANAYVALAAWLVPTVASIGALRNDGRSEVAGCGRLGGRLNLRLPRLLAGNSQSAIGYAILRGVPASRLYFLPNVVDTGRFRPATMGVEAPPTLLAVGRLVRQKRLDRFIALLARLRREFHLNVRGLIVGPDGDQPGVRAELEAQARELGLLPPILRFMDACSDMPALYTSSAALVLCSDFEGTPNVLLEAMACGLPVLASRVGGVPEIVRHRRTGFVFEKDDLAGFASTAADLLQRPELRTEVGARARAYIEQSHSLERLPAHLSGLYQLAWPPATPVISETARAASH